MSVYPKEWKKKKKKQSSLLEEKEVESQTFVELLEVLREKIKI